MLDDTTLYLLALAYMLQHRLVGVQAWVDHYDEGEDDERVVKILLPLIGCAILACIISCYLKKHCEKDADDKKKKDNEEGGSASSNEGKGSGGGGGGGKAKLPSYKSNPSYTQRSSVSGESGKVLPHCVQSPNKSNEARTVSQQSAHSTGGNSSGYHSNHNNKSPKDDEKFDKKSITKQRPSVVSTVSRDIKPRLLPSLTVSLGQKHKTVSGASSSQNNTSSSSKAAVGNKLEKSASYSNSMPNSSNSKNYSEQSVAAAAASSSTTTATPAGRANSTLMSSSSYSGNSSLAQAGNTLMSGITDLAAATINSANKPRRTFSQPSIMTLNNRHYAPAARPASSIQYNQLKPYQRNCAPN